jgi:hypothetical protein
MFQYLQNYFLALARSNLDSLDVYNDLCWTAYNCYACRHAFYPAVEWSIREGRADRIEILLKVWNAAGFIVCSCNSVKLIKNFDILF